MIKGKQKNKEIGIEKNLNFSTIKLMKIIALGSNIPFKSIFH